MKAFLNFIMDRLDLILGLPAMIVSLIALKKYIFKKKNKMTMNLPRLSYECIGREEEKKEIKNRIINCKSIFIYGAGGIGKTTVIGYSIQEAQKDLSKIYDGVLYHKFSKDDSFEYACDNLSHQIDDSGLNGFAKLLNKGKYLIWLDGCENTNCLHDLLCISNNPVFVFASREKEQGKSLFRYIGDDNMIQITTLPLNDGEHLLYGKIRLRKHIDKKYRKINKQIAEQTNGHPYLILLTKENPLYKKNPEVYYQKLKTEGLNVISEEHKCMDLLKSAIGLDVDAQSERLSLEAQKALGFLGCMSEDGFPDLDDFFVVLNKKVKHELLKTHLIEIHDKKIEYKHPLVHTVILENANRLLDGNFAPLYDFIEKLVAVYNMGGSKYNTVSLSSELFLFKYHLRDAIKYLITNHLIFNSKEEHLLCWGLVLLADFGFFEDILLLEKEFTPIYNISECSTVYVFATVKAYIGLENYENCITCAAQYESTISVENHSGMLTAFNNSMYVHFHFKKYIEAINIFQEFTYYIETNNLKFDEKYQKQILTITELAFEVIYWSNRIDDMKDFIDNQIELINTMGAVFDKDDYEIIDAKLILAFSLEKLDYHGDALNLLADIFNSINNRYSFKDPHAIGIIQDIGRFFHSRANYNQANEFYKEILPYSERVFGNRHIITERIRADYEKNKAKMETGGIDESKVLIHISQRSSEKNLHTFVKNLINKKKYKKITK